MSVFDALFPQSRHQPLPPALLLGGRGGSTDVLTSNPQGNKISGPLVLQTLASTAIPRVYIFDLEMDDFMRLKDVVRLRHAFMKIHSLYGTRSSDFAPLIIIAGERLAINMADSEPTFELLHSILVETYGDTAQSKGDGVLYFDPENVYLVKGSPLFRPSSKSDKYKNQPKAYFDDLTFYDDSLQNSVNRILPLLITHCQNGFIWHNNSSMSLIRAIMDELLVIEDGPLPLVVTCTCDIIFDSSPAMKDRYRLGANLYWDEPAWKIVYNDCDRLQIPFVSIHGSLSGIAARTLSDVGKDEVGGPLWYKIFDAKARDPIFLQDVIRYQMFLVLVWISRLLAAVPKTSVPAEALPAWHRKVFDQEDGKGVCSNWTSGVSKSTFYVDAELEKAGTRAAAIPEAIKCPINNSLGDFAACVFDDYTVINGVELQPLPYCLIHLKLDFTLTAVVNRTDPKPILHFLLQKTSVATMENDARTIIDTLCSNSGEGARPILSDPKLIEEWRVFCRIVLAMIKVVVAQQGASDGVLKQLHRAEDAVQNGEMSKRVAAF